MPTHLTVGKREQGCQIVGKIVSVDSLRGQAVCKQLKDTISKIKENVGGMATPRTTQTLTLTILCIYSEDVRFVCSVSVA